MGRYYFNHYRGSFHDISRDTFLWIKDQPYVKEESITDRIVYILNTENPFVKCIEFKRNEEALNGADWEWWILVNESYVKEYNSGNDNVAAFRFRIQAKKLMVDASNNYHLFHYSNRNGLQIELLIERANKDKAYPLYALYTDCKKAPEKLFLDSNQNDIDNPCIFCKNGVFLLSASYIYDEFVLGEKKTVRNDLLVEKSIPVSILDFVLNIFHPFYCDSKQNYNHHQKVTNHFKSYIEKNTNRFIKFLHTYEEFPPYLKQIISIDKYKGEQRRNDQYFEYSNKLKYYFSEKIETYIPNTLSGAGVIDMRGHHAESFFSNYPNY